MEPTNTRHPNLPIGTTHVIPAVSIDFNPRPAPMRWSYDFTGPESGTRYNCWWNWHNGDWTRDTSFSDRHKKLVTIEEFKRRHL